MPRIKKLRNFAITLFIFQHLVTIKSFPIIDESSVQETLITTASSADFKLELSTENDVNKEDKSNEEPKKSYGSSMFEYCLPASKVIISLTCNFPNVLFKYFYFLFHSPSHSI